jgi:hypothetical protein
VDPIRPIALAAAVTEDLVLHLATDGVDTSVADAHDMKGVSHRGA